MREKKRVFVRGIGSYLPDRVLTNGDMEKIVDTSDEWIVSRTGIRERHIAAANQVTSDLAVEAATAAMNNAGIGVGEVDAIIVTTVTPDVAFPATACFVQQKLGMGNCPCMDMEAGCSGVIYGLELAAGLVQWGRYRNILLVAADKLSSVTDWTDRSTCVLLADGASGFIVGGEGEGAAAELLGNHIAADGSGAEFLWMPAGGSRLPATETTVVERQHFLKMNGKEVFKRAVKGMAAAVDQLFSNCQVTADQMRLFIPHQANLRIIEAIAEYLNLPLERFWTVLQRTGNTSSASVGIAWDDAARKGQLQRGDLLTLVAFGAGLTSGAALLRWMR
ncbi:MAG: ketoacyl-ACP synthase III [Puniceicoccales bacterium]|jgi:3-oxoacyl-[acyl-carrier-protein] synthase-3|nr:ketoacyl-ACP synthase III [Puniceicoccales bacterium]